MGLNRRDTHHDKAYWPKINPLKINGSISATSVALRLFGRIVCV